MSLHTFSLIFVAGLLGFGAADVNTRKILQSRDPNGGVSVTVSASSPRVDAIAITPALPYPQTGIYCNVTGDSRIPAAGSVFPLTIRVPVGVEALVVFANVTGTIPGSSSNCSSVVQQPGTSVVQQPGTSVVQQPGTSVVQQPGTSVVQQPGTSVVQQPGTQTPGTPGTADCRTTVVQQPSTVVQQPTTVVQQQRPASVVQQPTPPTPPASVVQQPTPPRPPASVVQQPTPPTPPTPPTTVVQQPTPPTPTTVVQQPTPPTPTSTVVQQPPTPPNPVSSIVQQLGRRLLQQPAPIEFISNNGSMGQPQLTVLDTVEGVPSIRFKPTASGQTASFTGALQVAVTTTNDGFGTPFIPYRVDAKISPNCGVTVRFVTT